MADSVEVQKRMVGPYILERKIGEGGMAEVWLARHRNLETTAAIKFLNATYAGHPEVEARFLDEGKLQGRLTQMNARGVNILPVFDYMVEDRRSYLVMRYIDGMGLDTRIGNPGRPLPIPDAVSIAEDMLGALGFAHSHGIIHRDVKPSNVLLEGGKRAFLMDFGIAMVRDVTAARRTRVGAMMGTLHYMSPEQITAARDVTPASDIYSFGCVLYEMLTGQTPFDPFNQAPDIDVQWMHLHQAPEPPSVLNPAISPALDNLTLQCLAKSAAERFADCDEVLKQLQTGQRRTGTVIMDMPKAPSRPGTVMEEVSVPWPTSARPGSNPSAPRSGSNPAAARPGSAPGMAASGAYPAAAQAVVAQSAPVRRDSSADMEQLRRQKQKQRTLGILGGALAAALLISGGVALWDHEQSNADHATQSTQAAAVQTPPIATATPSVTPAAQQPPPQTHSTAKPAAAIVSTPAPTPKPVIAIKEPAPTESSTKPDSTPPAPAYSGPTSGSVVWTGSMTEGQIVTLYPSGQVSSGMVRGMIFPKMPLRIDLVPSSLFAVDQAPAAGNNWTLSLRALNTGDGRVSIRWSVNNQ